MWHVAKEVLGGKFLVIFWRREWQSTPVFLPGKSHGQRSLVGYSPWGRKELDMTEQLRLPEETRKVTKNQPIFPPK